MVDIFVDPSFTSTGVVVLDRIDKNFTFYCLRGEGGSMRSYKRYVDKAYSVISQLEQILTFYERFHEEKPRFLYEIPPPRGLSSSGLYGLSFLIHNLVKDRVQYLRVYSANAVSSFCKKCGEPDPKKRGHVAHQFMDRLLEKNSSYLVKNVSLLNDKTQNDVATAFLFYIMEKARYGTILLV